MKIEIRSSGNVQTIDREQEESLYSDARTPLHPPKKTVKLPLWTAVEGLRPFDST